MNENSATPQTIEVPWDPVLDNAPKNVQELLRLEPEAGKGPPAELVGRKDDLKIIERLVDRTIESNNPKRPPALTIRAAPGAGKTSLIRKAQDDLRDGGIDVVELPAGAFTSQQSLSEAVKEVPPWSAIGKDDSTLKGLTDSTANIIDAIGSAFLTLGLQRDIPDLPPVHLTAVQAGLAAWRAGRAPSVPESLSMLAGPAANGMIVFVDEAQRLGDYAGPNPRESFVADVIGRLADPALRIQHKLPHTNLILSGLNDLKPIAESLGTYRMNHHRLRPLSKAEVKELITKAIANADAADQIRDQANKRWTPILVERYGNWTHHAHSAATAAEELLAAAGEQALTESWGEPALHYLTQRYRNTLYGVISENATKYGLSDDMVNTVIQGLRRQPVGIPMKNMRKLIGLITTREWNELDGPVQTPEEFKRMKENNENGLLRSGILELLPMAETGTGQTEFRLGVPSLAKFLGEMPVPNMEQVRADLAAAEIDPGNEPDDPSDGPPGK